MNRRKIPAHDGMGNHPKKLGLSNGSSKWIPNQQSLPSPRTSDSTPLSQSQEKITSSDSMEPSISLNPINMSLVMKKPEISFSDRFLFSTPVTPVGLKLPSIFFPSNLFSFGSSHPSSVISPCKELVSLLERESDCLLPSHENLSGMDKKQVLRRDLLAMITRVASKMKYSAETVFVAMNFLDRYHSSVRVTLRKQHYLAALTCIFLAGKLLEELAEPTIKEMIEYCPELFTSAEIKVSCFINVKRMEKKVIAALNWKLTPVTPYMICDEVLVSLKCDSGKIRPADRFRTQLDYHISSILLLILREGDLSCFKPSSLLRACFDFIDSKNMFKSSPISYEDVIKLLPYEKVIEFRY